MDLFLFLMLLCLALLGIKAVSTEREKRVVERNRLELRRMERYEREREKGRRAEFEQKLETLKLSVEAMTEAVQQACRSVYLVKRCKCGSNTYRILDFVESTGGMEVACKERGHKRWIAPEDEKLYLEVKDELVKVLGEDSPLLESFKESDWIEEHPEIELHVVVTLEEPNAAESSGRPSIPRDIQKHVYHRDAGKCQHCGSSAELHFDHIIPYSRGGSDSVENLQLLCRYFNL